MTMWSADGPRHSRLLIYLSLANSASTMLSPDAIHTHTRIIYSEFNAVAAL